MKNLFHTFLKLITRIINHHPRGISLMIIAACALLVCGCERQQVLRVAYTFSLNHPTHEAMLSFKDYIESQSNGSIRVDLYSDGMLGDQDEILLFTKAGTVDLAVVSAEAFLTFSDLFEIFYLPYYFNDEEKLEAVLNNGLLGMLNDELDYFNIYGWLRAESRNFYLRIPVESVDEMEGMLIRMNSNLPNEFLSDLYGFNIWQIAQDEEYVAMLNDTLDGIEGTILSAVERSIFDLSGFIILDEHSTVPQLLIGNYEQLSRFSDQQTRILEEGIELLHQEQLEFYHQAHQRALEALDQSGIDWIRPDLKPYRERLERIYDGFFQAHPGLEFVDLYVRS